MEGKTIYILGGTSEANLAARRLESKGFEVIISVATTLGEELAAASRTEVGCKDAARLARSAGAAGAAAIVDCTHPYAVEASRAARDAAGIIGVPCIRFTRPHRSLEAPHIVNVEGWHDAVDYLKERRLRALMVIGVRRLEMFAEAGIDFAARVLPQPESVDRCRELGIDAEDVIAAQPPHSVDFNRACIRRARAAVLVSKDSGPEGGLPEKVEAAALEGIEVLLVSRPEEPDALTDLDQLVEALRQNCHPEASDVSRSISTMDK